MYNSCQKDDLCTPDQATTPRLVIEFRDALNPLNIKPVDVIQIQEVGSTVFAPLNNDGATSLINTETVSIPLRTDIDTTSYNFIITENSIENTDQINFNYSLTEEYVSRACGFRVIYNDLGASISIENPLNPWINSAIIVNGNVTNNTNVHVQILH
jgi:hypothetical protein